MNSTLLQYLVLRMLVVCFPVATWYAATGEQHDEPSRVEDLSSAIPPRDALICGPNSVLMFLTICGIDVMDEDIAEIDVGNKGATLLQMRDACNKLGQPTEVRHLDTAEFKKLSLPAILHVDNSRYQHFHVMYGVAPGGNLKVLDGTTGEKLITLSEKLAGYYSGYVLITRKEWIMSAGTLRLGWGLIIASALLGVFLLTSFFRRGRPAAGQGGAT